MRPVLLAILTACALCVTASSTEAACGRRPVVSAAVRVATLPLRAARVIRDRKPVRRYFATHKPVRRVARALVCGPGGCR